MDAAITNVFDQLHADPSIPLGACKCGTLVRFLCPRCEKHLCQACAYTIFSPFTADDEVCKACLDDGEPQP